MNTKPNKKILLPLTATLLCMLVIFILSGQQAAVSNGNSKGIVNQIVETTVRIKGASVTEQQKIELVEKINSIAREYMHAVAYFMLGIFAQITILGIYKKKILSGFITLAFCVLYGISDEIHQLYVPGRAFQLSDIVMDTMGASVAIVLVLLTYIIKNRKKSRKSNLRESPKLY